MNSNRKWLAISVGAMAVLGAPRLASADEMKAVPVLRVALGPAFHLSPETKKNTELAAEVTAGASIALSDGASFMLNPELGYAYDSWGFHAFNATVGVGFGHPAAYVAYHPRLLAGSVGDYSAVGMRNGLTMHALADMASLEIGHQFVSFDGVMHHDIRLMFGVNPLGFVYVVAKIADAF
jgi:hypothetical protein